MDRVHRNIIQANKDRLVEISNYFEMRDYLRNKGVFTSIMIENIERDEINDVSRLTKLYEKLTHRGPDAYEKLVQIFRELKNDEAVKILTSSTVSALSCTYPTVIEGNRFLSIGETRNLNRQTSSNTVASKVDLNQVNNNVIPVQNTDGMALSKKAKVLKLEPFTQETSFKINSLEVKKAENFGSHPKIPVYSMRSKRRGVFFFINIIEFEKGESNRNGAERDRENLVTLFREMNFTIFYYENLTKLQMLDLLDQFIKSKYIKNIDSFFLCIQTHGDLHENHTIMEFSDGSRESIETIIGMFSNINCPDLVDKPKVFFFPFCRGKISDKSVFVQKHIEIETDGRPPTEMTQHLVPKFSDILICYGTIPGFMTHRDREFGSWYVREMCRVFAENAWESHIEELLKMVGANTMNIREIYGRTQVASVETRGFHKHLYLNPKLFDNKGNDQGHSEQNNTQF